MTKKLLMSAGGLLALLTVAPAFAQTTTNVPITVNLTVGSACVVNGGGAGTLIRFPTVANPLAFVGNLDGSNLASDAGTPLSITCNASTAAATFEIDAGLNDSGGVHRLTNGASLAQYRVYSAASRSSASEYLISTTQPLGQSITANTPFTLALYGRILQAVVNAAPAGNYTDTLAGVLKF